MAFDFVEKKKFNYWERVSQVFAFYILAIQPIIWDKTRYSAITEFKFKAYWLPAVFYFAICLVILVYFLFDKEKPLESRKKEFLIDLSIPQILAISYSIWCVISGFVSPYRKYTFIGMGRFEGVFSAIVYTLMFVFVSFWGEYNKWLTRGTVICGVVFSFIAILQLFYEGIIHPEGYNFWTVWFMSTMGNVDCVGGLVATIVPVLFCYYVFCDDEPWTYIALGCIGVLNFLFTICDVDSGRMGLIVALLVMIPFLFDNRKTTIKSFEGLSVFVFGTFLKWFLNLSNKQAHLQFGKKQILFFLLSAILFGAAFFLRKSKFKLNISTEKARKIALFCLIGFIVFTFIFVYFYKGSMRLVAEASQMMHGNLTDEAGSGRGYIWKTAWWLAKETPIFGTGPGTFVATYYPYDIFETTTDYAHNDFIQIAVCVGFVGLVLYCAFILALAVRAFMRAYKSPLIVMYGAGCAGYLVHSFFSFSIGIVTPMFWVMAGVLDKLVRQVDLTSSKMSVKKEHKQ